MESHGESAVGVAGSDELVARLMAFCEREDVEQRHRQFCHRHVDEFHGFSANDSEEKSHRVHELFTAYENLFERTLQAFLDSERISAEAFYAHCCDLQRSHGDENTLGNLHIVLSALDFDAFCELMEREAIETQRALKEAEDMGL